MWQQRYFNLPYGLDVWTASRKIMSIEWGHRGEFDLVGFRGGAWEAAIAEAIA
jgi:hypothetical protein